MLGVLWYTLWSTLGYVRYVGSTLGYVGSALECIAIAGILVNIRSNFGYFGVYWEYFGVYWKYFGLCYLCG